MLLGDKFEEYLNAPEPIEIEEQEQKAEQAEDLRKDLEQKSGELHELNAALERIRKDGAVDANYDEFNSMKLRAAILEQEIDSIQRRMGAT